VDVAIIAAPSAVAQSQALEMMAYHGRINFFGGLPKGAETTHLNANLIHYRELTVTGTTGQTVREYRTTLNMIANRNIEVRDLITGRYPLGEIATAVEYARSLRGLKTMIFPC